MMVFLLAIFAFLLSCASMKDVEERGKKNVYHIWEYYYSGGRVEEVPVLSEGRRLPEYSAPRYEKAIMGSYRDSTGNVHERSRVWIKVKEGGPVTDF